MSYLVLARKWRPQRFSEVVGQRAVVRTLQNALKGKRVPHALLFSGPRGVGKTTVARIFAKALNCENGPGEEPCNQCNICHEIQEGSLFDVHEIDGASHRGINEIRELRENAKYMPSKGRYKIYIIDEVHMLTQEAFNALLKTLEEPPPHVIFIFATTEYHKIPLTILSRCQHFDFSRISPEDMTTHLAKIAKKEGINCAKDALWLIVEKADGSLRDALSLFDQVISYADGDITLDVVEEALGLIGWEVASSLGKTLIEGDIEKAMGILHEVHRTGKELKILYKELLSFFRYLILIMILKDPKKIVEIDSHKISFLKEVASTTNIETIHQYLNFLLSKEADLSRASNPLLFMELLIVSLIQLPHLQSVAELVHLVDTLFVENASTGEIGLQQQFERKKEIQEREEAIDNNFIRFLKESVSSPVIKSALDMAKLVYKEAESILIISIDETSIGYDILQDDKRLSVIQEKVNEFFKKDVKIIIKPMKSVNKALHNYLNELEKKVKKHPFISDVVSMFDGTIRKVSPLKTSDLVSEQE